MKSFIFCFFIFSLVTFLSFFAIFKRLDPGNDYIYLRFTSKAKNSLVLGTSRAAQGIIPEVLNGELKRNDVFNYSFTIYLSPYGETYYESIKKKLDPDAKNGVFILAVDPSSICNDQNDKNGVFHEDKMALKGINPTDVNADIFYFLNYYPEHYWRLLFPRRQNVNKKLLLHDDGWLEVSVPMDSVSVSKRSQRLIRHYKRSKMEFSQKRSDYLIETVKLLKKHGQVYLVRLPIHPDIMVMEDNFMPDFNQKMHDLVTSQKINYFDMSSSNNKFQYTDGGHLYKKSGAEVTKLIADWIRKLD